MLRSLKGLSSLRIANLLREKFNKKFDVDMKVKFSQNSLPYKIVFVIIVKLFDIGYVATTVGPKYLKSNAVELGNSVNLSKIQFHRSGFFISKLFSEI